MLMKFTVSNYSGFSEPITLDLTKTNDYKFNQECVRNGLVNKSIMYGANAVGKTNLGFALIDIRNTILANTNYKRSDISYIHANAKEGFARFEYTFLIDGKEIEYIYEKTSPTRFKFESLRIEEEILYSMDFNLFKGGFTGLENYDELKHLNFKDWDDNISVLRYILTNAKLSKLSVLKKLNEFVKGMIYIRPSDQLVQYEGPRLIEGSMLKAIIEKGLVKEFELFLKDCGIDIPLKVDITPEGEKRLYVDYERSIEFLSIASSGTKVLISLFTIVFINLKKVKFLFIDEIDANLHFELAEKMIIKLKEATETQIIATTHNTDLMTNKIMRPDVYLLMAPNKISSLANATMRELRMGHNLEKLYQSGEFNTEEHDGR